MSLIAVTGSRHLGVPDYNSAFWRQRVRDELRLIHKGLSQHITTDDEVIVGDASGVDTHTRIWCEQTWIACEVVYADWDRFGKAAGPIRNGLILRRNPALLVAFPGGNGTANMVEQAERKGIAIVRIT